MIREPAVSGQFYPATAAGLQKAVLSYLEKGAKKEKAKGSVCPHAGYIYSGGVAGATLSRIQPAKTFIILGPNHTGLGRPFSVMKSGQWKTPLGSVEIDDKLASAIIEGSKFIEEDTSAHIYEHSIEVQLPFLQVLFKDFKFVPIVISSSDAKTYKNVGIDIANAVKKSKSDAVIIASSDMTHYEPQAKAEQKDKQAINAILDLDVDKLLGAVAEFDITMCGYGTVSVMLAACKELGATSSKLVKYQTSGDTSGDYSSVVGYAGILIT